jgi:hypothetical protein
MKSADRAAVLAIRRGMIVAEIRRAAGADARPEIRQQTKKILRLRKSSHSASWPKKPSPSSSAGGDRRAALRAMLNGPLDPRRGP